jgi:hypothetical protein
VSEAATPSAGTVRFVRVEGTTWPVDVGETEWQLRYAPDAVRPLTVAAIVAAYGYLIDPSITQATAIDALKRARRASPPA